MFFLDKSLCEVGIALDKLNELDSGCWCKKKGQGFYSYTNDICKSLDVGELGICINGLSMCVVGTMVICVGLEIM